jgi:hypothetical protein
MQPSAKGVILDVVGVILHSAEVGHGAIPAFSQFQLRNKPRLNPPSN